VAAADREEECGLGSVEDSRASFAVIAASASRSQRAPRAPWRKRASPRKCAARGSPRVARRAAPHTKRIAQDWSFV